MPDRNPESITDLFYQVIRLIPTLQQLSTIPHDMTVAAALEIMEEKGYSQIPVKTWDEVIGVFSYRSFCRKIMEMRDDLSPYEDIGGLEVEEFVERHRYVNEDDNWESILSYISSDNSVLVGNNRNLSGIVTAMDVVDFLYRFAKPFVVIAEIELAIRRVILNCVSQAEFHNCIQNSLVQYYTPEKLPSSVTEMTSHDYHQVIGDGRNWKYFEPFFGGRGGSLRKHTRSNLEKICNLRNDAFHFKRAIDEADMLFLNNMRSWLHRRARIFESDQARAIAVTGINLRPVTEIGSA
jgi:CBS domain-containing protein